MKRFIAVSAMTLLAACSTTSNTTEQQPPAWSYEGNTGPAHWAQLTPEYGACNGKNQSPVDLTSFTEASLKPLQFQYKAGGNEVVNNGHTVQVNYDVGSSVFIDGVQFNLVQFHFHAPSENHINGMSYPLEAHLVHKDRHGNLAVVAVMFKEGTPNEGLAKVWAQMPQNKGDKNALSPPVSVSEILPKNRDHYRFNGSLTTPPCSEGVIWTVMKQPMTASKAQIAQFAGVLHHANNRPIQATNARTILK
ncbi:MAG: Carbonic anhydrase (EC [uncultured Thiotrichaceae bacterium]|uniref:Carbonic anhydrase n=1 Tax=uncultured Thiotrichaceae bacterium TaxID=298394 RepID=A0A6S6T594_9GAMM|nr:MAG: Carbonic anhydrase (EC [uncultured Thiotrichaceae bacterium]